MTDRKTRRVTRRTVLQRAAIAAAAVSTARGRLIGPAHAAAPLSLILTFADGKSLSFSEAQATEIGNYVGAYVQQKCLRQRQGPWTVFFRPDVKGPRREVVVEYGTEFGFLKDAAPTPPDSSEPAHITSPYIATIDGGGLSSPIKVTVPRHWWSARWRWQSEPRPIRRRLANLVAMKALPPYSTAAQYTGPPAPDRSFAWGGPMTVAGLDVEQGDTGDRPEIGLITEYQARYLLTGNAAAELTMRAQAEAAGTMAIHIRDAATGAPFSVFRYPYMRLLYGEGDRYVIPKPPAPREPARRADRAWFQTNLAHFPSLGFVPWLLTDDPFFLEEEQFGANYGPIQSNFFNFHEKLSGLCEGQTRGWAWGMRDLFRMAAFAPETPPSWLALRSYWRGCVADNLTYAKKFAASTSPVCKTFHMIANTGILIPLMIDYLAIVFGWARWSGLFPEWDAVVVYAAGPRLAMCADPAAGPGWDRRLPAPYKTPLLNAKLREHARPVTTDYPEYAIPPAQSDTVPANWADLWSDFLAWYNAQPGATALDPANWPPNSVSPQQIPAYLELARTALASLSLAGLPDATAALKWLEPQMPRALRKRSLYKWAIWAH